MTSEEKINQLQLIEQNLQQFLSQKQQFQSQFVEVETALKELKNAPTAYKIIGNIMVLSQRETLEKDLQEKKERLELRISMLEKQETKLRDKAKAIRQEVVQEMEKTTKK